IADSICTLLGHPGECPHGLKIPEGKCCRGERDTLASAIVSLDRVRVGEPVKISYINTLANTRMHKLAHFGIIPGAEIKVHQKTPAFVLQCGNTQVAMEGDVAKEVYVIAPPLEDEPEKPRRRRRWGRGK
ncbi:MAG: FeoA domain-containing protein, partial [Deltaproteobacteria bacterium]|nr:FeoA domain-containing protein [Deltaproteobacteria bacterium]